MNSRVLYRIVVKGRVQGVGFRWHAAIEARSLGITGFVKNMSDGSVFIEAEGSEEQVGMFLDWCRSGPSYSAVESIDIEKSPPVNYADFRIEH